MTTVAFHHCVGGVGATSLVYHLTWMLADQGLSVLAADLDPQATLTGMFLETDRLEQLWTSGASSGPESISANIGLMAGGPHLATFEEPFAEAWLRCKQRDQAACDLLNGFIRSVREAAGQRHSDVALIDVGPTLGAVSRVALSTADHVVIPLLPDVLSSSGLQVVGAALRNWRELARECGEFEDVMRPAGYVITKRGRPYRGVVKSLMRWQEMPGEYRRSILGVPGGVLTDPSQDPNCLAVLTDYRSLAPMALEARKPMFFLKPADGAVGAHVVAVRDCYLEFRHLAFRLATQCGLPFPSLVN